MSVRFTSVVPDYIHEALKLCAQRDKRSMNSMLNLLLEEALVTRGLLAGANHKPTSHDVLDY